MGGHTNVDRVSKMLLAHVNAGHKIDFAECNVKDRAQAIAGDALLSVFPFIMRYSDTVDPECRVDISTLKSAAQSALATGAAINSSGCNNDAFVHFVVKQVVVIMLHARRLAQRQEVLQEAVRKMSDENGKALQELIGKYVERPGASPSGSGPAAETHGDLLAHTNTR